MLMLLVVRHYPGDVGLLSVERKAASACPTQKSPRIMRTGWIRTPDLSLYRANRLIKCATYSCCEVAGIILSGLVAIWLAYTGRELAGGVRDSAGCGACNPEALWP